MIAGVTQTASFVDTHSASVAYDEIPELSVLQPDGTTLSPDPTLTSTPDFDDAATAHTLTADDDFTEAGEYSFRWSRVIGSVTSVYAQVIFAAWTDVYSAIRSLLNRTVTQLPDSTIDIELARVTRQLIAQFPCVVSYNALSAADRPFFDDALVYFVAARLRPTLPAISGTTGEVQSKKQGSVEVKYATSSNVSAQNLVQNWLTSGWETLRFVACIGYTTPIDTENVFKVILPDSILSPMKGTDEAWAKARGLT